MKIASLRFSNVMVVADYAAFPSFDDNPGLRKWNLWSYIDARDAAQAVRKALEAPWKGAEVFIIASPDTVMSRPITELVAEFYPDVPWRQRSGRSIRSFQWTRRAASSGTTRSTPGGPK